MTNRASLSDDDDDVVFMNDDDDNDDDDDDDDMESLFVSFVPRWTKRSRSERERERERDRSSDSRSVAGISADINYEIHTHIRRVAKGACREYTYLYTRTIPYSQHNKEIDRAREKQANFRCVGINMGIYYHAPSSDPRPTTRPSPSIRSPSIHERTFARSDHIP